MRDRRPRVLIEEWLLIEELRAESQQQGDGSNRVVRLRHATQDG